MKELQTILTHAFALLSSMILVSIWITESETYKVYVFILLFVVLFKFIISDRDSE